MIAWHAHARGEKKLEFKVEPELIQEHGKEYLEALLVEIGGYLRTQPRSDENVAVINRRKIVTIVDGDREHAILLPLARFLGSLDDSGRERVQKYLDDPKGSLLVLPLQSKFLPPRVDGN